MLSNHDIDIVFGCESHIDQSFSSSEILLKNYKIIRKDRSLGGGGVFIGFKDYLNISEVPELAAEAEMIWAKLSTPKQKPLYLCSLYRIPNNDSSSISSLSVSLQKLHQIVPNPEILLSGDLNLPSITWSDGGVINSCPTYGHGINQLFLDTVNEYGLEQLIIQPTRGKNILDLVFSTQPNTISNLQIIPGISDHEAIFSTLA